MTFVIGFLIWLAVGIAGGLVVRGVYRGPTTTMALSVTFGILGAFVGGMLGVAAYITHDPNPMRFGGLLGAALGTGLFSWMYHVVARKAL